MKPTIFQIIPTLESGGAEIFVETLTLDLIQKGYECKVISLYSNQTIISNRLIEKGVEVFQLNKKSGFDLNMVIQLHKLFKKYKPHIVHSHLTATVYSLPASLFVKELKNIHTIHSIADKEGNWLIKTIYNLYYKFFNLIPVAISEKVRKSFELQYNYKREIPLIHNGVNLRKCTPKNDYNLENNSVSVVNVASFKEVKNHTMLIDAWFEIMKVHPNAKLKLVGVGKLKKEIEDKVNKLQLEDSVVFIGETSDVFPYLNSADVFILPSLWEGMPLSLIEAMGTGLPIIATNVGGITDMLDNRNALLINANKTEIKKSLINLIENPSKRKLIGEAAYKTSSKYSSEIMTAKYISLYNKV